LAAISCGVALGCTVPALSEGLRDFRGVERRFQRLGEARGVMVIDDYAHHPTEVSATLAAARASFPTQRLVVVFQPHLYSRTQTFAQDFGQALDGADEVFVLDVYAAREQPLAGVSGATVADHVSVPVTYVPDFSSVAEKVARAARPGDVVITMGAGDVTMLGREIIAALQLKANRNAPGRPGTALR